MIDDPIPRCHVSLPRSSLKGVVVSIVLVFFRGAISWLNIVAKGQFAHVGRRHLEVQSMSSSDRMGEYEDS